MHTLGADYRLPPQVSHSKDLKLTSTLKHGEVALIGHSHSSIVIHKTGMSTFELYSRDYDGAVSKNRKGAKKLTMKNQTPQKMELISR